MLPNILLILSDDLGYSDLGCYGGEIKTQNLDLLAENGLRFTQFYNTARCSPSRASLLTGLHPHQTGIGILTDNDGPGGYPGNLNSHCVTIAEVLKQNGYRTYMSGKWHLSNDVFHDKRTWPRQRGFDKFFGTLNGAGSYFAPKTLTWDNHNIETTAIEDANFYYTDAISDYAVKFIEDHAKMHSEQPFFQYVAYTAPHWPLHALEEDIAKYRGCFTDGWDQLRKRRIKRMKNIGIVDDSWELSERDPNEPAWEDVKHKDWLTRCMEVYAAQIDRMDQGIGKIVKALKQTGQYDNTLIIFLSDNGGSAEGVDGKRLIQRGGANEFTRCGEQVQFGYDPKVLPGPENTYQSYGRAWANLSNTPFRKYKHWVHEGGISTPCIVTWPKEIKVGGSLCHVPGFLPDVMATVLDVTGAEYPSVYNGNHIFPLEGKSLLPLFNGRNEFDEDRILCWEHEGNAAVRWNNWKLVRDYPRSWELYDMNQDRTELNNLADIKPELVIRLSKEYDAWAKRCGVIPREQILKLKES